MMPRAMKDAILRIYFFLRLPVLYLLKALFKTSAGEPESIFRILVIRLDRLGDFVLSLPLIDSLRAAYPSAKIDLIVRPYLADIAGMVPAVNEVLIYKGKIDAFRWLPARKYDVAIDMLLDYKLEPALVALFSKSPVRIGFKWGFREVLFNHPVGIRKGSGKSMVEFHLDLLKPLGIRAQVTVPKLIAAKREDKEGLVVAIHPGGHYDSQKWGAGRFSSLVHKIMEKYHPHILVIGGHGDKDEVERIVKDVKGENVKAVFPTMKEFVGLLSRCSLLICNNSGPLHLAGALGVPTVSMMGPADPILWRPQGEHQMVIQKGITCRPCMSGRCRKHQCMDLITVDDVFAAVESLLENVYGIKG